jgi:anion-transporting  ArsA/GET3 family ATPase
MTNPSAQFDALLDDHDVVVCAGSGGVGKTTISAVLGLHAALKGQKVLVMTIDPARRLANSLGVDEIGHEATELDLGGFRTEAPASGGDGEGELWAMMLDMKQSFDDLVERRAPDEETRRAILDNRFYRYFSTSLSGTQEYAAAERVYDARNNGDWDLIILDTPPTTHALDFLEAPSRLANAVENRALQWLYDQDLSGGRSGFDLFSMGSSYVLKTIGRFTGAELLDELSVFLSHFSAMLEGFRERARDVEALMTGDACQFVVVTSPDPHTRDEALYFYDELGEERVAVGGFVVNRRHPHWVERDEITRKPEEIARSIDAFEQELEEAGVDGIADLDADQRLRLAEHLRENAGSFFVLADKDTESVQSLRDSIQRDIPVATVPYFSRDIHSLEGLDRVRSAIFDGS